MMPNVTTEKLKNLTSLITKGSTPTTYGHEFVEESDSEASFFGAYNCTYEGEPKLDKRKWITLAANKMLARSQLSDKDTVLCIVGNTIGSSFMVKSDILPANINQNVALIRPIQEKIYPLYLRHIIQSPFLQHQIVQEASTQAQPSLSLKQVGDLNIFYPAINEQQKIAKILSTWDKAISMTDRLIENSTQQKKALMQQLLTGKKRLLDDEGNRFEGEWEEVSIGSTSKCFSGGTPSRTKDEYYNGNIPWITSGKLNDRYVDSVNEYITELGLQNSSAKIVKNGSILVAMYGATAGKVALNTLDGATVNQAILALEPKEKSHNLFLFYLLEVEMLKALLLVQGGQPNLSATIIKAIKIKVPTYIEQQKIAIVLTNADKEIELLEQQLADLQQEKKALMQVLLTGKKRVVVDA
ncbi:restriction endonuclease subunit S [Psychrobacter proteolyticus]|uniref:restriction endonuclease subunit S n=1 Tax=Psychrobacter proteolyticus TaxID=147825 RepID=UPI003D05EE5E